MDKKKGLANVFVSVGFKIAILVASLFVRRILIQYIGNGVNGLNSLYTSIIGFLAVTELGVGTAITYCMYKPIVEGDHEKVSALYRLFTRLYLIIGGVILVCGCILMPFLKYLAKDYTELNVNLYLTFVLSLFAVIITYLFSSKTSLINAYKNDYLSTTITSSGMLLQCGLQIVVIILTRSFVWYLVCAIISALLQWGAIELIARKKYGDIIRDKQTVDKETKGEVVKNVKAMFMHKIGNVLVNTADSIIISAFLGVTFLGKYSNYTVIMNALLGVINLFFVPLTSVIGHLFLEENKESVRKYYNFFYTLNFMIGAVFFLGAYAVIDNLVSICFESDQGLDLVLNKSISFVITLNYYLQFSRQATLLFRDATGTFYNDRWKPLIEGVLNIALSIALAYRFGAVGVIAATIFTNVFICHIVEPHVLHKYALQTSAKKFYIKNYIHIMLFTGALIALHFSLQTISGQFMELVVNGCIAVAFALVLCLIAALTDGDFRHYLRKLFKRIRRKS